MTPDAAERRARAALEATRDRRECGSCGMADPPTDGGDFHVECPKAHPAMGTYAVTTCYSLLTREMSDALARDVLSLADALRAAEARAVAAEASLRSTGDSALRITTQLGAAMRERDAADARCAALAGAVESVRAAVATVAAAGARYGAAWDAVDAMPPTASQSEAIAATLRVSYEAQETLDAALDALLRGAPGGYVPARVVREYLDAAAASENDRGDVDRITDAIERGLSMNYPGLTDANRRAGVSGEALHLARAAVDAALAAAGCP